MKGLSNCIDVISMNSYIYIICTKFSDWWALCKFYLLSDYVLVLIQGFFFFERNSADSILAVAPVSNKALVVIVFPITIGILQSWWITYCAGAKKNKGYLCLICILILSKVCSPFFLLTLAPWFKIIKMSIPGSVRLLVIVVWMWRVLVLWFTSIISIKRC